MSCSCPRHACYYCAEERVHTRPYGPGGARVCAPCVFDDPEREAAAHAAQETLFYAALAMSPIGIATPDGDDGPQPIMAEDLPDHPVVRLLLEIRAQRAQEEEEGA